METTVYTSGLVQGEGKPAVATESYGKTVSQGGDAGGEGAAWSDSAAGPGGLSASAGHEVHATGDLTGSAGDQRVQALQGNGATSSP